MILTPCLNNAMVGEVNNYLVPVDAIGVETVTDTIIISDSTPTISVEDITTEYKIVITEDDIAIQDGEVNVKVEGC